MIPRKSQRFARHLSIDPQRQWALTLLIIFAVAPVVTAKNEGDAAWRVVSLVILIVGIGIFLSGTLLLLTYLQIRFCQQQNSSSDSGTRRTNASPSTNRRPNDYREHLNQIAPDTLLIILATLEGMSIRERIKVIEILFPAAMIKEKKRNDRAESNVNSRNQGAYDADDDQECGEVDMDNEAPSCSICLGSLTSPSPSSSSRSCTTMMSTMIMNLMQRGSRFGNRHDHGHPRLVETACGHVFHYACCEAWLLNTTTAHDSCPYCRADLYTVHQLRSAAVHVLGKDRVDALGPNHATHVRRKPPRERERRSTRTGTRTSTSSERTPVTSISTTTTNTTSITPAPDAMANLPTTGSVESSTRISPLSPPRPQP